MSNPKTFRTFDRKLPFLGTSPGELPEWWNQLLALWRPSGVPSGDVGLRLAIRNGYANFYRKGQSVAHVSGRPGQMQWKLHRKYLGANQAESGSSKSPYRLAPPSIDLLKCIAAAEERCGREKEAIDEILGRDASVIDLEMGLPSSGEGEPALRIDMVSLEEIDASRARLTFWEVKTFDDARIRSRSELPADKGILGQVQAYRTFLSDQSRAAQVRAAYRQCAVLLQSLACAAGNERQLGPQFRAVADGRTLELAEQPGLLVAVPESGLRDSSAKAWEKHRKKLEEAGLKIRTESVRSLVPRANG